MSEYGKSRKKKRSRKRKPWRLPVCIAFAVLIGSLGLLEEAVVQIAGLTGSPRVKLGKRAVLVMCADNGVVAEGVTQTGQEVTALVAGNMVKHDSSVCRMGEVARADVFPVDMGMIAPAEGVRDCHIRRGTGNMTAALSGAVAMVILVKLIVPKFPKLSEYALGIAMLFGMACAVAHDVAHM